MKSFKNEAFRGGGPGGPGGAIYRTFQDSKPVNYLCRIVPREMESFIMVNKTEIKSSPRAKSTNRYIRRKMSSTSISFRSNLLKSDQLLE